MDQLPQQNLPNYKKIAVKTEMSTGRNGLNFENMAKESELQENLSKVIKDVIISQQQ